MEIQATETICLTLLPHLTKHGENLIFCFFQNIGTKCNNFRGIEVDMIHFLYVMFSPDTKVFLLTVMGLLPCLTKK